jgi:hypothetical protein
MLIYKFPTHIIIALVLILVIGIIHLNTVSMLSKIILASVLIQAAFAAPNAERHPTAAICQDFMIPITVTSDNFPFVLPKFANNYDLTDFTTQLGRRDVKTSFHPFGYPVTETATYQISASFCTPRNKLGGHESTVLLASHGLGFDRRQV